MSNEYLLEFSNAISKVTDLAQPGGVIFKTPCRLHRPPFEVGLLVHITSGVFPGRSDDVFPVVRSIQYAADGPPARAVNMAIIFV